MNGPGGRLLGAVFAGGQARRFGADKAFARLGGQPLVAHACALLAPLVDTVILCGRNEEMVCGVPAIPDRPRPGLGPLGGLAAALHHAANNGFAAVLTVPCDTPLLPDGLLARLLAAQAPAIVAECPVIGLWPAALAAALDHHLGSSADRSVVGFARQAGAQLVPAGVAIANINTPADLLRLGPAAAPG